MIIGFHLIKYYCVVPRRRKLYLLLWHGACPACVGRGKKGKHLFGWLNFLYAAHSRLSQKGRLLLCKSWVESVAALGLLSSTELKGCRGKTRRGNLSLLGRHSARGSSCHTSCLRSISMGVQGTTERPPAAVARRLPLLLGSPSEVLKGHHLPFKTWPPAEENRQLPTMRPVLLGAKWGRWVGGCFFCWPLQARS